MNNEYNALDRQGIFIIKEETTKYNYGIDLLKIIAMILVSVVHATTMSGWTTIGKTFTTSNFFVGFGRMLAFCCVPLFMVTTGYLCRKKEMNLNYYKKIVKVLIEYFICSSLVYFGGIIFTDQTFNIIAMMRFVFNISNQWYISMYIGLFLLIPFLNILYNNIITLKKKLLLLSILIIVFSLPGTCFIFSFNYWLAAYPIMYYFIGCFLSEYKCTLKKPVLFLLLVLNLLLTTYVALINIQINVEVYCNLFCLISTVLLFMLVSDYAASQKRKLHKACRGIADSSLSYYILGAICENYIFKLYCEKYSLTSFAEILPHLFIVVPIFILITLIMAFIINKISTMLYRAFIKMLGRIQSKKNV